MSIRKRGGLYFWQVGRFGGSVYVKRGKGFALPSFQFDTFGLAACAMFAIALYVGH